MDFFGKTTTKQQKQSTLHLPSDLDILHLSGKQNASSHFKTLTFQKSFSITASGSTSNLRASPSKSDLSTEDQFHCHSFLSSVPNQKTATHTLNTSQRHASYALAPNRERGTQIFGRSLSGPTFMYHILFYFLWHLVLLFRI